ncbi:Ada metal-binding domain-containing protein [Leuconostoc suionicum]|uniref:Ada metal-binding domain-containing protein n=1 Tax=Leuconostoc suionicum TaxID=1511761 RepID=UPI00233F53D2|nr:Ada metal-binding domain-containing protein [Leuconostoc suionicum]MDC2805084.1 Ada metal-binding domain-containing protein [Leuconostoc suionicum]MDC2822596.1 Ada metal-binding domain-containing protein [Leuconostoc suionicum]
MELTDSVWEIIKTNSNVLDGKVWYGVKSTKIFCKPSCPSRIPNKSNVLLFTNPDDPVKCGFRPCKRCQPINEVVSDEIWVAEINHILENYYDQNLTLAELAILAHGSISHLRHVYQSKTGISPSEKLMQIRMDKARILLLNSNRSISNIGNDVGIPNNSYFIKIFKKIYGITPHQYRAKRPN